MAPNYTITYQPGTLTVRPDEGRVAYIGQTLFVTSGASSTTAQVTLTASVQDVDGIGNIGNSTVTFTDVLSGKVLASGVKVTPVSNTDTSTGTANTVVTLSTGQYGAQQYLIQVQLNGSYINAQQLTREAHPLGTAEVGSDPYNAAHPTVTVMIPQTVNSMQGAARIDRTNATPAGLYGDAKSANYTIGMKYNKGGTNPQEQVQLILHRSDGTYYVKSNSISSVAFSNPVNGVNKDVTIYTKASVYKVVDGVMTSVEGNVTLRVDARDRGTTGDTIGFTVLSSKDSSLYYSNNWTYDEATKSWRTVQQPVTARDGTAVVIA